MEKTIEQNKTLAFFDWCICPIYNNFGEIIHNPRFSFVYPDCLKFNVLEFETSPYKRLKVIEDNLDSKLLFEYWERQIQNGTFYLVQTEDKNGWMRKFYFFDYEAAKEFYDSNLKFQYNTKTLFTISIKH